MAAVKLRDAVLQYRPFESELETLEFLSKGDAFLQGNINILKENARYGLSDSSYLKNEFIISANKVIEYARQHKKDKSFFDKAVLKLSSIVDVQKVTGNEDSNKIEDIIARARTAVNANKIDIAINEIQNLESNLTEQKSPNFSHWLEIANNYLITKNAAEDIFHYVTKPDFVLSPVQNG